jgi:hypothetical protein
MDVFDIFKALEIVGFSVGYKLLDNGIFSSCMLAKLFKTTAGEPVLFGPSLCYFPIRNWISLKLPMTPTRKACKLSPYTKDCATSSCLL